MYYSLAPKQIIGVSGKPLAFGTHYDIANYLGHIHEDIAKKYRAEGKNIANTNTIASNIEYALNVIFGINIEDVPITDQIIRATSHNDLIQATRLKELDEDFWKTMKQQKVKYVLLFPVSRGLTVTGLLPGL